MTSKERVLTTFAHQEPDRVPINYCGNLGIDGRLKAHFGVDHDDDEGLRQALEVDFRNGDDSWAIFETKDGILNPLSKKILNSATRDVIDDLASPNNIRELGLKKRGSSRG